jgi:hypothetical protein
MVESNKTYVGVVEDNLDPEKMGRVKVRVMDVFDEIDIEDIPFATPWKDLNGNQFNIPEVGKVVMVVFDQGSPDSPEYIYADHYNVNLENKLNSLSDKDYTSMKSLIFDHKTQIYVNDTEGLKIDHKYNNLNLTDGGIDINLKDNNSNLNIGDSTASQQAILGNHFMEWMDEFLNALQSGALFNAGGPTTPTPTLIKTIVKFKAIKDLKFLSHHVNIVDNNKVNTVSKQKREDEPQYGDKWTSTTQDNNITKLKAETFNPIEGPNEAFNEPVEDEISDLQELEDSASTYEEIVKSIREIYQLKDTLNNGDPLFKEFKGRFNDNEKGATDRLLEALGLKKSSGIWFKSLNISELIPEHKSTFINQVNSLIKETKSTFPGQFQFLIPNVEVGKASRFIQINSNF